MFFDREREEEVKDDGARRNTRLILQPKRIAAPFEQQDSKTGG